MWKLLEKQDSLVAWRPLPPAAIEDLLATALLHLHQPSLANIAGHRLGGELGRREKGIVVVLHIFLAKKRRICMRIVAYL